MSKKPDIPTNDPVKKKNVTQGQQPSTNTKKQVIEKKVHQNPNQGPDIRSR